MFLGSEVGSPTSTKNEMGEEHTTLLVVIARTTPELEAKAWKRSAERRVPLPDNVKIIEQYVLLGQNKTFTIVDAPDATTVAKSALNWADVADMEYCPAITA